MAFDYTDKVEDFFAGGLQFIKGFFITLFDLAFRPARFAKNLGEGSTPYVKPFSFLTISTFSIITVARRMIAYFIVAWLSFTSSCAEETNVPIKRISLTEVPQLPSLETIIYVALPVVLFIIILARLADNAVLQRLQGSPVRVASILPYVTGMQFVIIPLFLAVAGYIAILQKGSIDDTGTLISVVSVVGVIWPAVVFYRICSRVRPALIFKSARPLVRRLSLGGMCVTTMAFSLSASGGVAYILALQDTQKLEVKPMLSVGFAQIVDEGAGSNDKLTFSTVIQNNSESDLWVLDRPVTYDNALAGQIIGGNSSGGSVHLPAGREVVVQFRLTGAFGSFEAREINNPPILRLLAVNASGRRQVLASRMNKENPTKLLELHEKLGAVQFPTTPAPPEVQPRSLFKISSTPTPPLEK